MMRGGRGLAVVGLGSLAPQPLGDALPGRLLLRCVAKQLGHPAVERIQQPRHGSSRWLSAEERGGRFQSGVLQEEGGSTAVWLPFQNPELESVIEKARDCFCFAQARFWNKEVSLNLGEIFQEDY